MAEFTCNGWKIFFYPLFNTQWLELREKVKKLKDELPKEEFLQHPDAKLLKALNIGIKEKIPQDPLASYFVLQKPLQKYGRLKKMGLPERYRLFFRVFKEPKIIIILWLGFPRKEGDKKDCYQVFTKKVENGEFLESIDQFIVESNLDNSE
ncbi:type II toxin-antitoxin system YhaV family toxin [Sphaerospermopsis aphanizomenoides BCCUSP55]|uniref:type II toxin-antitoxin system YhaV family toxin n=1 Tax=Sphaerospermopsis aphanizomenoides TaxID=459663 RepID=UPI001908AFE8|nr:type II toxin-antitoxin system YhaV family toxin [Sphaerospermopsis aphanizomenoides]MBK1987747.1 type II toxin-antitoxin system YhaV family toxin [Sphaerospermopsis aphanizomenoides BCCUSP55]